MNNSNVRLERKSNFLWEILWNFHYDTNLNNVYNDKSLNLLNWIYLLKAHVLMLVDSTTLSLSRGISYRYSC